MSKIIGEIVDVEITLHVMVVGTTKTSKTTTTPYKISIRQLAELVECPRVDELIGHTLIETLALASEGGS